NCVRVDCEPSDIQYLLGANPISHAIATGLQADVEALHLLLTHIRPDEVFENLEKASAFIFSDRPSDEMNEYFKAAARQDLFQQGLIDNPSEDYRSKLDYVEPEPPQLPDAFRANPKPFRSPFDSDGGAF